jgi:hypothetical protein
VEDFLKTNFLHFLGHVEPKQKNWFYLQEKNSAEAALSEKVLC